MTRSAHKQFQSHSSLIDTNCSDMSETTTVSKRNPGSRSTAIAKVETRLPRCVQRRLPCASVPVRCHPRPTPYRCADQRVPKRPYRLAVGLSVTSQPSCGISTPISKNCTDRCTPSFLAIGTPRCKKSLSMMELSLPAVDPDIGDLKSEGSSSASRLDETDRSKDILANGGNVYYSGRSWTDTVPSSESDQGEVIAPAEDPKIKAANVVCHMLVLNAWRHRRAEITQLEQQVEHLHLQIEFLRRLLIAENERVSRLNGELHREKAQVEEATRECEAVKSEKGKLQVELKRIEEVSQERLVTVGNLKNDLLTAQDQLKALDAQMTKDREKLLKLREDKRILLDKVSASEALAAERGARAEKAESAVEKLQLRLATQITHVESAREKLQRTSKELQATEVERQKLEKRLRISEVNAGTLNLRALSLENQLTDQVAVYRRLETEYKIQMSELSELKERLLRQSQEGGWSSRMLQIAGSIMRASILRTFGFLSSTALPLPP